MKVKQWQAVQRSVAIRAVVGLMFCVIFSYAAWSATPTQLDNSRVRALAWLIAQQQDDGRWAATSSVDVPATAQTVEALRASGVGGFSQARGLAWLANAEPASVESVAKKALALDGAGVDSNAAVTTLLRWRNISYAWGAYDQFATSSPDTALAIAAIRTNERFAVERGNVEAALACSVLASQRVGDASVAGSWGFSGPEGGLSAAGRSSHILPTVHNLLEIAEFASLGISQLTCPVTGTSYSLTNALSAGANWLVSQRRNSDGSFGSPGTTLETALAYLAIARVRPGDAVLIPAHDYMLARQAADGSWQADAFVTATVLKTLGTSVLVDTDSDEMPDAVEVALGRNPNVADSRFFAGRNGQSQAGTTAPVTLIGTINRALLGAVGVGPGPFTSGVVIGALPDGVTLNLSNGALSGTPTSAGNYNFIFQYVDASAVSRSVLVQLSVSATVDTTPPVVTPPATRIVEATAVLSNLQLGNAFAIDDVDGPVSPAPSPNGPLALGQHTITWRAVDKSGNAGTATQQVTVRDTTPPTIAVPPGIERLPTGQEPISLNIGTATASDIFGPVQLTNNAPSQFPAGETTVTYTAVDANGNVATAQQLIAIVYPRPVISALTPNWVRSGSSAFSLIVRGTGFAPVSFVQWNGQALTTTFMSSTELRAEVSAQRLVASGDAVVEVSNPAPGGGLSAARPFLVASADTDFFDDFDRIDGAALGNGWIEKNDAAFELVSGEARKQVVSTGYVDNLVYRPSIEDARDVEAAVEFRLLGSSVGYPQVHVRVQGETVTAAGVLDSYLLFLTDSPTQAMLARQRGAIREDLAPITLSSAVSAEGRYRLRLRAQGSNPVQLSGYIESWGGSGWALIGEGSFNDNTTSRLSTAGTVGFSGYTEAGYVFDRFTRQRLDSGDNPLPVITQLSPVYATVGDGNLTLTVNGSGFVPGAQVRWNGTALTTSYVGSTRMTASVPASLLSAAGAASVTVFNPTPGGGSSAAQSFLVYEVGQVPRAVPVLSGITPAYVMAGGAGFTLVAVGSNFSSDSVLRWDGVELTTTYVSATQLQATISAASIATPTLATVTVYTPAPGGGSSLGQLFRILSNDALFSDSFDTTDAADLGNGWIEKNPDAFALVGAEVHKQATSTNYHDNLVYRPASESALNVEVGVEFRRLGSGSIGYPQLHARVRTSSVAQSGVVESYLLFIADHASQAVLARQGGSGGATQLGSFTLSSALTTNQVYRLRLRTTGTNPVQLNAYVERWLGTTQWEVLGQVAAQDSSGQRLTGAGTVGFSGSTEGGSYAYENFTRLDLGAEALALPTISGLSPNTIPAGSGDFLLTVNGSNFNNTSLVRWNGVSRTTSYISSSQLQATIPAADIASAGNASVTVFTVGAGESASASFSVSTPLIGSGPVQVILMAGQSNMNGWAPNGSASPALLQEHPGVLIYYKPAANSEDNGSWQTLQAGANNKLPLNGEHGLELRLAQRLTSGGGSGGPVFFIKFARDATGLDINSPSAGAGLGVWSPSVRGQLYDTFMDDYVHRGLQKLVDAGFEPRIQAFLWMQGEDDSRLPAPAANYEANLEAFVARVRADVGVPNLPVIMGRIHDDMPTLSFPTEYVDQVRAAMTAVDSVDANVHLINTDDYGLRADSLHFNAAGESAFADDIYDVLSTTGLGAAYAPPVRISSVSPDVVPAGGGSFVLNVRGMGFAPTSSVRINGQARSTTFVSATELTAVVLSGDVAVPTMAAITVFNSASGTESNEATLYVGQVATSFVDNFARPDAEDLGNGWMEKNPEAFAVSGNRVVKRPVGSSYTDNLAYRPSAEDVLNTEVSIEFRLLEGSPGYPQLLARVQPESLETAGLLSAYMLFVNDNATQAVLARHANASMTTLNTMSLSTTLNVNDTYRLRLRVSGTSTVLVNAYIERLNGSNWTVIGEGAYADTSSARIPWPGSVGFGGYIEGAYSYDNFARTNLSP